jgi:hypothetical protein
MHVTENSGIEKEIERYSTHLNLVVGVLIFAITMACLSLPNPQKAAFFALPIILGILLGIEKVFPETVHIVRQLIKETNDLETKKQLKAELKDHFNIRWLFSNVVFFYAAISFLAVLMLPEYTSWLKAT